MQITLCSEVVVHRLAVLLWRSVDSVYFYTTRTVTTQSNSVGQSPELHMFGNKWRTCFFPTSLCGVLVFASASHLPLPCRLLRRRPFFTQSFTHNFVTHNLSHTTHSFTHNVVTHTHTCPELSLQIRFVECI